MKRLITSGTIALAVGLSAPQFAQAQGTLYISSLGLSSTGGSSVGNDSWLAADFWTGNNPGGYLLNSVQLALTPASGNPSGVMAMIYNNRAYPSAPILGSSLGTLNGSLDPVTAGVYTYSPASNLTLSPSTAYFIVLTAGTAVANGAYEWSFTSTYAPVSSGGWYAGTALLSSSDGLNWHGSTGSGRARTSAKPTRRRFFWSVPSMAIPSTATGAWWKAKDAEGDGTAQPRARQDC